MRLYIGGARGSMAAVGKRFEQFGGHTTSMLVLGSEGERLILDAGSGMQPIVDQLTDDGPGDLPVLFSHYHLDHLVGLTMNLLFYQPGWSFKLLGPVFPDGGPREAVTRLMSPPYWPITCDRMSAKITFSEIADSAMQFGSLSVRTCPMPHPGGCMTYRIEDTRSHGSFVYATDIEWAARTPAQEQAFLKLCAEPTPAEVLYIDSHFARAEAKIFAGMGHTCWEDCVEIARSAGVGRLLLGHHRPQADDAALQQLQRQAKESMETAEPARAGTWLQIGD